MTPHTLFALSLAAALTPVAARAQDPGAEEPVPYDARYPASPGDAEGGYQVSADVDATGPADLTTFQAPLAPYGEWVTAGSYGTVWRPRVVAGWRPYYYGRWEWTTEGWLWVSDEPFGWATYHYGRWTWDRGLGWIWVPGYQWAPAWVSWRYGGDVIGWAPLAPGLSLYVTDFAFVDSWWTFVPSTRFCGGPVYGMAYAPAYSRRWYEATRPAPPRPVAGGYRPGRPVSQGRPAWGGPPPRFVEERQGRPLTPARIVTTAARGEARVRPGEIGVYRPESRPRPGVAGPREGPIGSRGTAPSWDRGAVQRPSRAPAPQPAPGRSGLPFEGGAVGPSRAPAPPPAPARPERPFGGAPVRGAEPPRGALERGEGSHAPAAPAYQAAPAPAYQAAPAPARGGEAAHGGGARPAARPEGRQRDRTRRS